MHADRHQKQHEIPVLVIYRQQTPPLYDDREHEASPKRSRRDTLTSLFGTLVFHPMSNPDPSTASSSSASAPVSAPADGSAPKLSTRRKSELRTAVIFALLSLAATTWLARAYLSRAEAEPDNDDTLALSIVGGWWSISGERHLALEWEGRRASLRDYSTSEAGAQSTGSWRYHQDHGHRARRWCRR